MTQNKRRDGYTLIEMLAVLMLVSTLITMVGVLLRRSLVGYSQTIDRAFQIQASERWTERIRNEIHQAEDAVVSDDHLSITLRISETESTMYTNDGDATIRQRIANGRVQSVELSPWRSSLRFAKFDRAESFSCAMIEVTLAPGLCIQARLGIDANAMKGNY